MLVRTYSKLAYKPMGFTALIKPGNVNTWIDYRGKTTINQMMQHEMKTVTMYSARTAHAKK